MNKILNFLKKFRKKPTRAELISTIVFLWDIIDDIDTASDQAKSNNVAYRRFVEKIQWKRWQTGITTDGYTLDFSQIGRGAIQKGKSTEPQKPSEPPIRIIQEGVDPEDHHGGGI